MNQIHWDVLELGEPEAAFKLWSAGKQRFAVTAEGQTVPVIGFVSQQADKTWIAERRGAILHERYPSVEHAARALMNLARGIQTKQHKP